MECSYSLEFNHPWAYPPKTIGSLSILYTSGLFISDF